MIPRIRFAHLPTAIEAMPRLSAALGGGIRLFIKRDDQTGLAFGGNKTRKLEYVLAEAQAHGAKALVTCGAVQSNHCRQTAALAARYGLKCYLVLAGEPELAPSGNYLLDQFFGAEIIWCSPEQRDTRLREVFLQARDAGLRPFEIPLGASTPTGALGYVNAFKEFSKQKCEVDWMVLASSSGGTQAGLVVGAVQENWNGKILGVSVDHTAPVLQSIVCGITNQVFSKLDMPDKITPESILVEDRFAAPGYGVLTHVEKEAIQLFAKWEGILIDPVYTGRAAAGLIEAIRNGRIESGQSVLFWHTGGTPSLFASRYSQDLLSD
ncbi:MAG TPA: D-cysteine desulfhydrase family protein [Longilinea sp.]|nr:D-cysteine desulfhydrase family protein [Longilinea sp.]